MALFHYLHLRTFCHETDDPDKVRAAMRHVASAPKLVPEESTLDGANGNRIVVLEAEVRSAPSERALFEGLRRDDLDAFERLEDELPRRIDEHLNFHLRLDKQAAYEGRTRVTQGDDAVAVRAKLKAYPGERADPRDQLRAYLVKLRNS